MRSMTSTAGRFPSCSVPSNPSAISIVRGPSQTFWRKRSGQPGLLQAPLPDCRQGWTHVEGRQRSGPLGGKFFAQPSGRVQVDRSGGIAHHAISESALGRDQTAPNFQAHQIRLTHERVTPTATTPGHEVEHVSRPDGYVNHLAGNDLLRTVHPVDPLAATSTRFTAVHSPRVGPVSYTHLRAHETGR